MEPILRCGLCNKPFDKQSTLKRHGYYCRSRRLGGSTVRSRSCLHRARAKVRCDNRLPQCSRCKRKAIECHYTADASKHSARIQEATIINHNPNLTSITTGLGFVDNNACVDEALMVTNAEAGNHDDEYLSLLEPDIDLNELFKSQTDDKLIPYFSPGSSPILPHLIPLGGQIFQDQQATAFSNWSLPMTPSPSIRSFVHRSHTNIGSQKVIALIFQNLKSYPLMMLQHRALPPFISSQQLRSCVEDDNMEPLTDCINLVNMIRAEGPGSRKLFWKIVRRECERFCEQHTDFSEWRLIAAFQALCIYILIRIGEGETDYNNIDRLLLSAVTILSKRYVRHDIVARVQSAMLSRDTNVRWKAWIFEESKRRLCVIYQVLNMLVYFEPAELCNLQEDLLLAPLPSRKGLWEAQDEYKWQIESEIGGLSQADFGMTAKGGLVELNGGGMRGGDTVLRFAYSNDKISPYGSSTWEDWYSGMDACGCLVMLAASLVA